MPLNGSAVRTSGNLTTIWDRTLLLSFSTLTKGPHSFFAGRGSLDFGIGGLPDTNKSSVTDGKKGLSPDLQKFYISLLSGID